MPKYYVAMKLDPLYAMNGHVPMANENYPCSIQEDLGAAMNYLAHTKPTSQFPSLSESLKAPAVDVLMVCTAKYPIPAGEYPSHQLTQMSVQQVEVTIGKDEVFDFCQMGCSPQIIDNSFTALEDTMKGRLEVAAQLQQARAQYPTCDGIVEWFQTVATNYTDMASQFPALDIHINAYANAFYEAREANPQLSRDIVVRQAIADAARTLQTTRAELFDEFEFVESVAEELLMKQCIDELVCYQPNEYLSRVMADVPEEYKAEFLNTFSQTFAVTQQECVHWTVEQQAAHAIEQTADSMVNALLDRQIDGVFGKGQRLSEEEYMQLHSAKQHFVAIKVSASEAVKTVNALVEKVYTVHDDWSLENNEINLVD